MLNKDSYFEASYHIPLIIKHPGAAYDCTRGQACTEYFTESVDVLPTIVSALGGHPPAQCDGRSLLPLMGGQTPDTAGGGEGGWWREEAHWEHDFRYSPFAAHFTDTLGVSPHSCNLAVLRGMRYK